jgi:hypothetical protein
VLSAPVHSEQATWQGLQLPEARYRPRAQIEQAPGDEQSRQAAGQGRQTPLLTYMPNWQAWQAAAESQEAQPWAQASQRSPFRKAPAAQARQLTLLGRQTVQRGLQVRQRPWTW